MHSRRLSSLTLCFEILAIVFDKLNHAAFWAVFFVPSLLLGAKVVCGIGVLYGRRQGQTQKNAVAGQASLKNSSRFDLKMVVLYVGLAAVGLFVFVKALDGPACFNETYDNLTHLGLVQLSNRVIIQRLQHRYIRILGKLDLIIQLRGIDYCHGFRWSNRYIESSSNECNELCLLLCGLSAQLLMSYDRSFSRCNRVVVAGAFAAIGSFRFPWFFTVYGVLESNLFGFIMVPVMLAAIMQLGSEVSRADRARYSISFVSALFCVFAQPNAFFAVIRLAVPYLVWRIWDSTGQKEQEALFNQGASRVRIFIYACSVCRLGYLLQGAIPLRGNSFHLASSHQPIPSVYQYALVFELL